MKKRKRRRKFCWTDGKR